MEKGDIDVANDATVMAKDAKSSNAGLKVLSAPSLDYGLIGFVSHDYDKKANKTGKVRPKYEDKELRKAMLYAIDEKNGSKRFSMVTLVKSIVLYHLCIG